MKFVIQRVKQASVKVVGSVIGEIEKGYLLLIGVSDKDTEAVADKMIKKMIGLRIFEDAEGKTNLSLADVGGSLLLVSQFTLYANCKKGNRPSFIEAGAPDKANQLYEYIIEELSLRCNCSRRTTKIQVHFLVSVIIFQKLGSTDKIICIAGQDLGNHVHSLIPLR